MGPISVGRPFPTLALFAIYAHTAQASLDGSEDDDQTLEASKVLFFSAQDDSLSKERKQRLMGTVIGMADFARMLSPGDGDAPSVRSVHSHKQHMVWIEPEKGFFIHASIELPRASRHSRAPSTATNTSNTSTQSSPTAPLEDGSLLASLSAGYRQFRLTRGSFERQVDEGGRAQLRESLEAFWVGWIQGWNIESDGAGAFERVLGGLPKSPFSTPTTETQLAPLLAQFAATNSSAIPVLLHGSEVMSLPDLPHPTPPTPPTTDATFNSPNRPFRTPPPPVTEDDLVALVHYLAATRPPPRTTLSVRASERALPHSMKTPKLTDKLGKNSDSPSSYSPSKWTPYVTFGMSSYLSQPTMPSLPAMPSLPSMPSLPGLPAIPIPSMPSLSTMSMPSIPGLSSSLSTSGGKSSGDEKEPHVSGGWGLRNVSWGSLGMKGHSKKSSSASSLAAPSTEILPLPTAEPLPPSTPSPPLDSSTSPPSESETSYPPVPSTTHTPPVDEPEDPPPTDEPHDASPTDTPKPTTIDLPPPPSSPATQVIPREVDIDSLAEVMDELETPSPSDVASLASAAERPHDSASASVSELSTPEEEPRNEVLRVFCGEGAERDTRVEVRRYQRGSLSLALATLPLVDEDAEQWLDSRSNRLLEAVEALLDLANPSPPLYPHRHIVKSHGFRRGPGWSSSIDHWSGKASAEDNEVSSALFECLNGATTRPRVVETFIRTSSSQWAVGRRSDDSGTDVFAVLPPKVGKEGSLVDAADEVRKLERAYRSTV